jgi:hypothetical protein
MATYQIEALFIDENPHEGTRKLVARGVDLNRMNTLWRMRPARRASYCGPKSKPTSTAGRWMRTGWMQPSGTCAWITR